jgi:hypothetical protein
MKDTPQSLRRVVVGPEVREDPGELLVVVAVARRHVPPERAQLRLEIAEREDLVGRLVRLQLVAVDDDAEVVLRVRGGRL